MKKILGIFCLVMALVGGYRISKVLTTGEGDRPTGNSAYDAGRRTGMIAVPVVYALFGIWLITHSDVRVFSGGDPSSRDSWLTRGITAFVTLFAAIMAGWTCILIVQLYLGPAASRTPANRDPFPSRSDAASRFPAPNPAARPIGPPPPGPVGPMGPMGSRQPFARPGEPGTGGIFSLGDKVDALWAGRWRPGTVTDLRGPTVFVRFDDSAMPPQMWTFTNQVRMRR